MPAFGAAGVKQKIVEIPQHQAVAAFRWPQPAVNGIDLDQNFAIDQQSEYFDSRRIAPMQQFSERLRGRQHGQHRGQFGIANPKQRARERRFQHQVAAAPAHIGEARQRQNIACSESWRLRPVIRNLRLDDHLVGATRRTSEPKFQKAISSQSPD